MLIVSGAYPPSSSGEAQHAFFLARHLARRGLEVDVLTGAGAVEEGPARVHALMLEWSWRELPTLVRVLRSTSPDAVLLLYIGWIYGDHPMITYAPTVARLVRPRTRFVTQLENVLGALPARYGRTGQLGAVAAMAAAGLWRASYRFGTLLRDSSEVIVLGERHRRAVAGRRGAAKAPVLIPPPPLLEPAPATEEVRRRGREVAGAGEDDFLLVHLGYLYPQKRVEDLLEAFALVARRRDGVRLAVAGGPLEGHEEYAARLRALPGALGIEDRVRWTGAYAWDGTEGSTLLRAADAFVIPIDTGVALNNSSLGAAASHGLPLIGTRPERLELAFRDRENILLCPPGDPQALAEAIETVIDDETLRRRLAQGASELADRWYSWDTAVERTIAALGG